MSRLLVRALAARPFLGQRVTLQLGLEDYHGQASVLVSTSRGLVADADNALAEPASAVRVTIDPGETHRVTWMPAAAAWLDEGQDALESMLRYLNPEAATPAAAAEGLAAMVREYRWEANVRFRQAVDAHLDDYGRGIREGVDHMARWPLVTATVVAYLTEAPEDESAGAAVLAGSALTVQFRDWLPAWLQTYEAALQTDQSLTGQLTSVRDQPQSTAPGALVNRVNSRVREYLAYQFGEAGQRVAEKAAEKQLGDFLATGLASLPKETRIAASGSLEIASASLSTVGTRVVDTLGRSQTEIGRKADQGEVTSALATKADQTAVTTALGLKADQATVTAALGLKADRAALEAVSTDFDKRLGLFREEVGTAIGKKLDVTQFTQFQGETKAAFDARPTQATVDAALKNKLDANLFTQFQGETKAALDARPTQATVDAALKNKLDANLFTQFQGETKAALDARPTQAAVDAALKNKLDANVFTSSQQQTKAALDARPTQVQVDAALGKKLDANVFTSFQTDTKAALDARPTQATVDAALSKKLDGNVFANFQQQTKAALDARPTQAQVDTALSRKVDTTAFTQFQLETRTALGNVVTRSTFDEALKTKADVSALNGVRLEMNTALATKVDQGTFNQLSGTLENRFTDIQGTIRNINVRINR